jgi:hypothetical protein
LKVVSDRMKARFERLANSAGLQEGDSPIRARGKSPKLQPSWEVPYKVTTLINDVVCHIQRHPRVKTMVVHLNRLAPNRQATRD